MSIRGWLRRKAEEYLDRFYAGPIPPTHHTDLVAEWANANPKASRLEWMDFSLKLARMAYSEGYMQGAEAKLVDEDPSMTPDTIADAVDPGWRRRKPLALEDPDLPPTAEPLSSFALTDDLVERMARPRRGDHDDDER